MQVINIFSLIHKKVCTMLLVTFGSITRSSLLYFGYHITNTNLWPKYHEEIILLVQCSKDDSDNTGFGCFLLVSQLRNFSSA